MIVQFDFEKHYEEWLKTEYIPLELLDHIGIYLYCSYCAGARRAAQVFQAELDSSRQLPLFEEP